MRGRPVGWQPISVAQSLAPSAKLPACAVCATTHAGSRRAAAFTALTALAKLEVGIYESDQGAAENAALHKHPMLGHRAVLNKVFERRGRAHEQSDEESE